MIRWGLLYGLLVGLGFAVTAVALGAGCYAHTQPNVNCAANPFQDGCYPPVHDAKKPR